MVALHGKYPDKVPFTVYECMIPQCQVERELRNRGLCIVQRVASHKIRYPNVTKKSYTYPDEKGTEVIRTVYSTPCGDLSTLSQPAGNTIWTHEHMIKSPEDYKVLLYMIQDSVVEPDYDHVMEFTGRLGEDFIIRDSLCLEPIQALISIYMGTENFCIEWMDNRDEVLKLYNALVEVARRIYPIAANGPFEFANYGGNVVPQIIGVENFKKYFVPHYNEAAEILHKKNKLIGCHFDADNTIIMDAIAGTELDYIEAYDVGISPSVKEARKAWPDKVLWLNWPSAWHLLEQEEIYNKTIELIREANPGNGLIIGITEDVPEERWQQNYFRIMDAIDKCR
jgi:hypothetical protein